MNNQKFRDINIIYEDMEIALQVDQSYTVSQYFKKQLLKNILEQFVKKYGKEKMKQLLNLQDISLLWVALNTKDLKKHQNLLQPSAGSASFQSYKKSKRMTFYIHKISKEGKMRQGKQQCFKFSLMRGQTVQNSMELDIKNMTYQQLQKQIRQKFTINEALPFNFLDKANGLTLKLKHENYLPGHLLQKKNIYDIGIYPIYQNGYQ